MRLARFVLLAVLVAYPCARLVAHVRLIHPGNGAPLRWGSPGSVSVVVSATGSDDIPDGSHATALRLAIQDWNAASGNTVTLVEDASATSRSRSDFSSSGIHLVLFDETNESGYFPPGSSTVAITPVWFGSKGVIQDADVLFNGASYRFTTSGAPGCFDVEDVGAHELGHLLGLDHSGSSGATMYPYVDQDLVLHRSLSADEVAGLRDAYPAGAFGRLRGTVVRAEDGTPVAGAYVVARDAAGRTRASVLADAGGAFELEGLDPGDYTVYARPLDATVDEGNLGSWFHGKIDTDFAPGFYPPPATITGTETLALGPLEVGADVALNLGTSQDPLPLRAIEGESQRLVLHGSSLFLGCSLQAADPDLVLGTATWVGSYVVFQLSVPAGEARGHVDLMVTDLAGHVAVLPSALEITPPSPLVTAVAPASGRMSGGELLTLRGSHFGPGARVVIGEHIYTDGVDVAVLDAGTITLTTAAGGVGTFDVVVIDASGVEGRREHAFRVHSEPGVHNVLPGAGVASGGTSVVIAGEGFSAGARVRIDGVDQGAVTVEDPSRLRFTTVGGAVGGPYVLEVENEDGAITQHAFAYVPQEDPLVGALSPDRGAPGGGSMLTLTGAHFTPTMGVRFFLDPADGGVPAASVTFVDAGTLEVVTPALAAGKVSLLVADTNESGAFVEEAFTVAEKSSGGSCSMATVAGPPTPRAVLEGAWWIAAVLGVLWLRARRTRGAAAPA